MALTMSRPRPSVPSQATVPSIIVSPGGRRLSRILTDARSYGSVGEIHGASTAMMTMITKVMRPTTATLLSAKSETNRRSGVCALATAGVSGVSGSSALKSVVVVIP